MNTHSTSSGIAPLDISTIKHIYQKAVLISKLEEEAQSNDLDFEMSNKLDSLSSLSDSAFDLTLESIAAGKLASQIPLENKQDSTTWSPTCIKTKEENNRLRLLLNVREEELSLLREKYKSHEMELLKAREEIEELRKASEKPNKLSLNKGDESQQPYQNIHARVEMLGEDLKYCRDARDRLSKEVLRLEKDFNLEREARAKLESTLHDVIQEKQRDILFLEENWKSLHENEVARLKRTIDDLNHKLNREEEIRRCVQLGLDSLHRHFTNTSPPSDRHRNPIKFNKFNGLEK